MLTPAQESSLTSGGDNFDHWHSADRVVSHGDLRELQALEVVSPVTSNTVIGNREDFILADTSSNSIIITLPEAKNGREIEIVKNAQANALYITTWGTNLILGSNVVIVYNYGTSLRFKAIPGGWTII